VALTVLEKKIFKDLAFHFLFGKYSGLARNHVNKSESGHPKAHSCEYFLGVIVSEKEMLKEKEMPDVYELP
jgi:hypothetical protein